MNTARPTNDYRDYLAHHGVKGMKWGHRKKQQLTISPISPISTKRVLDPNNTQTHVYNDKNHNGKGSSSIKKAGSILGGITRSKSTPINPGGRVEQNYDTRNRVDPLSWEEIDKADREASKREKEYNEVYYDKFTGATVKNKTQEYTPKPDSREASLRKLGKVSISAERVTRAVGKGIKFLSGGFLGMAVSALSKKRKKR